MGKKVTFKKDGKDTIIEFVDLEKEENIKIIKDNDDDDEDWDERSVRGKIVAITPFLCIIAYLLAGFYLDLWHPGWVIFFLIPIVPLILKIFSGKKSGIISLFILLIVAAYFILGFLYEWWHPGWVLFLLIPVVSIIFGKKA